MNRPFSSLSIHRSEPWFYNVKDPTWRNFADFLIVTSQIISSAVPLFSWFLRIHLWPHNWKVCQNMSCRVFGVIGRSTINSKHKWHHTIKKPTWNYGDKWMVTGHLVCKWQIWSRASLLRHNLLKCLYCVLKY